MTGRNIFTVFYVIVSLLCVSISTYLSYWGYLSHLQELTILFAAVIGVLLFACDLLIRQFRIAQKSLLVPFLFFILVAAFSGASNFNFLYTNFMHFDIAERTVNQQFRIFREDLTETRSAVHSIPDVQQTQESRVQIERELDNLFQQLTDPLRPGCGERCRSHVANIHDMLGGAPTDLALPAVQADMDTNIEWFENYRATVMTQFVEGAAPEVYRTSVDVHERIEVLLATHNDPQAALEDEVASGSRDLFRGRDLPIIETLRQNSLDIERRANTILPPDSAVSHRPIQSDLDKLGEIPVSFYDGFVERPNTGVTVVSAVLGVFVDFVPILFALVIFGPDATIATGGRGARGGRSQRVATH